MKRATALVLTVVPVLLGAVAGLSLWLRPRLLSPGPAVEGVIAGLRQLPAPPGPPPTPHPVTPREPTPSGTPYAHCFAAAELTGATVTVFRFGQRQSSFPRVFSDLPVESARRLPKDAAEQVIRLLSSPDTYQPAGLGAPGNPHANLWCLGLRFETGVRRYDVFVSLPRRWVFPANTHAQDASLYAAFRPDATLALARWLAPSSDGLLEALDCGSAR